MYDNGVERFPLREILQTRRFAANNLSNKRNTIKWCGSQWEDFLEMESSQYCWTVFICCNGKKYCIRFLLTLWATSALPRETRNRKLPYFLMATCCGQSYALDILQWLQKVVLNKMWFCCYSKHVQKSKYYEKYLYSIMWISVLRLKRLPRWTAFKHSEKRQQRGTFNSF